LFLYFVFREKSEKSDKLLFKVIILKLFFFLPAIYFYLPEPGRIPSGIIPDKNRIVSIYPGSKPDNVRTKEELKLRFAVFEPLFFH